MPIEEMMIRLLLSAILGGLIGAEREHRNKSVGLRTLILISLGSCLFTIVSVLIDENSQDRIASTVVTGIGFLGAGAIFKGDFGVKGLTTAATVWVVAAIGMAVGGGYYLASVVTVVMVLLVLYVLGYLQRLREKANKELTYRIQFPRRLEMADSIEEMMKQHGIRYRKGKQSMQQDSIQVLWHAKSSKHNHNQFIKALLNDTHIEAFDYSEG
jgi:putative Mg2+ transporter-C (MgtC) family protein